MKKIIFFLTLLTVSIFTYSKNTNNSYLLKISTNSGNVKGFMQTPSSGTPGTSDLKRPTFDDLDIDTLTFYNINIHKFFDKYSLYIDTKLIRFDERGILQDSFISMYKYEEFKKGSPYKAFIKFDLYNIGVTRNFIDEKKSYDIRPLIEFSVFKFNYTLETSLRENNRHYTKGVLRLGAESNLSLNNKLNLNLHASTSIKLSYNSPSINSAKATLFYKFINNEKFKMYLYTDIGYLKIDYVDNQEFPNHVRLQTTPYYSLGLGFEF